MIGNNELHLNPATVIEALQEYFDRRTTDKGSFTITSIRHCGTPSETFVVRTTSDDPVNGLT